MEHVCDSVSKAKTNIRFLSSRLKRLQKISSSNIESGFLVVGVPLRVLE